MAINVTKHGLTFYMREFKCALCDCEFEARAPEVTIIEATGNSAFILCDCPECGCTANIWIDRRQT